MTLSEGEIGPNPSAPVEGTLSVRPNTRKKLSSPYLSARAPIFDDDVDAKISQEAEGDAPHTKTLSRRLVEKYLQNYNWYFMKRNSPRGENDPPPPMLTKAWAYYEHFTLARYLCGETGFQRAEPGELRETRLFNPFTTPESSLNQWGIGVGLYFTTLRAMAVLLIVTGCINIVNIRYFGSSDYSGDVGQGNLFFSLLGTAICTNWEWVACSDCQQSDWTSIEEENRFGTTSDGTTFVLRNACNYENLFNQGIVNWASLLFLIISIGFIAVYQQKRETIFDEDKITATDYSVVVKNPPKDAMNPDDWHDFFSQFGQVTFVTVAVNNGVLLQKLFIRRIFVNNLRAQLPRGFDMDDEDGVRLAAANREREIEAEPRGCIDVLIGCTVLPILRLFNFFLAPGVLVDKIIKITAEIKELQKKEYEATQIFVTFETEEGQRTALTALKVVSKMDIMNNTPRNNVPLFQRSVLDGETNPGGLVLKVEEPTEPNAVRWQDLHVPLMRRLLQRIFNLCLTLGIVSFAGFLVARCRAQLGPGYSGPLVTILNTVIPVIVKLLMLIESHASEGSRQNSLYLKITLFRWVNTAILTKIITPFTSTVGSGNKDLLPSINSILWSELLLSPTLRVLDITGLFKKHYLAPRAPTQEQMNLWFQGTPYNLGERYTDFTKVIFVCFFYSALFPSTFFFCGSILIVQYYVDKFCLMRVWATAPFIGTELATFSRRYFISGALLAFAIVSSYVWAQFPYDNLCDSPADDVPAGFTGTHDVTLLSGKQTSITVQQNESVIFCSQSWKDISGFPFPATSQLQDGGSAWMTSSQEDLANLYGWSAVVLLVVFVVTVFGGAILTYIVSFVRGSYKPKGREQNIDFSTVAEISAYIPQINIRAFPYPLLACNIDNIDTGFIGWNDGTNEYDKHNMIFDVPYEGMERPKVKTSETEDSGIEVASEVAGRQIFSIVKHWPPKWSKKNPSIPTSS